MSAFGHYLISASGFPGLAWMLVVLIYVSLVMGECYRWPGRVLNVLSATAVVLAISTALALLVRAL